MSGFLRVERTGAVATIWIDRQAKMNTMTVAMRNEFPGIFAGLDADAAVRAVVVRGAGGKAFSAGGDVSEFLTLAPADLELWGGHADLGGALSQAGDRGHRRVYDGGRPRAGGRVRFSYRHAAVGVFVSRGEARHDPGERRHAAHAAARGDDAREAAHADGPAHLGRRSGGVGAHHPGRAERRAGRGRGRARGRARRAAAARAPHAEAGLEPRG